MVVGAGGGAGGVAEGGEEVVGHMIGLAGVADGDWGLGGHGVAKHWMQTYVHWCVH